MKADEIVRALRDGTETCAEYDLCDTTADLIESLQAELAASRRRERAAVEDLVMCMHFAKPKNNNTCNFCKKDFGENGRCLERELNCSPEWRGPEEGEKE